MKTAISVVSLCLLLSLAVSADEQGFQDPLLDRLVGNWILRGTIAGNEITHDIVSEWVLGHHYLRFHEISREKNDDGGPEYEAIVFIGWDQPTNRYACLWLDLTGGGGLSAEAIGYAEPSGDELAFVFDTGEGGIIHNTFSFIRETGTWKMSIDIERDGEYSQFARVSLVRQ